MDSFVVESFLFSSKPNWVECVNGSSFDDYFTLRGSGFITKSPYILKRLEMEGCIQNMSKPTPNFKSKRASQFSSLQSRLIRWGMSLLYKLSSRTYLSDVELNSPSVGCQHTPWSRFSPAQWAWSMNDVGSPTIHLIGSDTMLKITGPNSSLQNWLVRWGVSHLYRLSSKILSIWFATKSTKCWLLTISLLQIILARWILGE